MSQIREILDRLSALDVSSKACLEEYGLAALRDDIVQTLRDHDFLALPIDTGVEFLRRVFGIYLTTYDEGALTVAQAATVFYRKVVVSPEVGVELLAELYDMLLFLFWVAGNSVKSQAPFGSEVVAPFVGRMRSKSIAPRRELSSPSGRLNIAYLVQFAYFGHGNALSPTALDLATALIEDTKRFDVCVYAWHYVDQAFRDACSQIGAKIRTISAASVSDRVDKICEKLAEDGIDIVLTDMNTAVPTLVFLRRAAPVQLYLQFGMPFWPVPEIDGVLLGWHGDPSLLGFKNVPNRELLVPWSRDKLYRDVAGHEIEQVRGELAKNRRIIGVYGRQAKINNPYLEIIRQIIERNSDVLVVFAGTGSASHIRPFIARNNLQNHVHVIEGFVDGQVWGHILEIFLDTFPLHGGLAAREMIVKGRPVVSMLSEEMPNLPRERDPELLAGSSSEYADIASHLLQDRGFMNERIAAASALARQATDAKTAAAAFRDSMEWSVNLSLRRRGGSG